MTENYTFVTLVIILKLTALQMLSLNPFIHFQEEWFIDCWSHFFWQMNFSRIKTRLTIIQIVLRVFKYPHLIKQEFEDTKGVTRIRILKKNRKHNGQKKKYKKLPNSLSHPGHYRWLDSNDISVIEENTFNNLPNLGDLWVSFSMICIDA